jgi:hypothetical protein
MAVVRACEAVDAACATLRPVRVGLGRAIEGRLAFNRRAVRKDGTVAMPGPRWDPPLGPTWIQYIEGPIDPEVGVLCLQDDDLRVPAVLAHYTCHPVHVFPKPIASSDWPGALAEGLASALGPECVGVVVNGACGNINPWDPFDPHYLNDHRRMGAMLAVAACSVVQGMQFRDVSAVGWTARRIELPVREVEPGRLAAARATLDCHPTPRWTNDTHSRVDPQWLEAASIWSAHLYRARQRTMQYEVQVFRIGDAAIVGLPGEPFVEGQLAIKMRSPAAQTFVAHCTTQYVGYIPTREAFARGGHEVNTTYWSKLMPDALDTVVETAAEMLGQLFAERAD